MKPYVPKFKAQVEISAKYIYSPTLLGRAWIWFLPGVSSVKKILRWTLSVVTMLNLTIVRGLARILKWMRSASMRVGSLMTDLLVSLFRRSISRHFDFRLVNDHLGWEQEDLLNPSFHSTELKRVRKGEVPHQYVATIFGGVDAFLHSDSILTLSRHPHSRVILPDVFNKSLFLSPDRKVGKLAISPVWKIENAKMLFL